MAICITAQDTLNKSCQAGLYWPGRYGTGLDQAFSMRITCAEMSDYYVMTASGEPRLFWKWERGALDIAKITEWGQLNAEHANLRVVKQEQVGRFWVSTIFLPIDHAFFGPGPLIWETMVFVGEDSTEEQTRCGGTREQAEAMHAKIVARMQKRVGYLNAKK